jgi:ribosome-associated protein
MLQQEKITPCDETSKRHRAEEGGDMLDITDHLAIPDDELTFITSRSSGPGGQHVNKVSSRITLKFNVLASPRLSAEQKQQILTRLATRIDKEGVLRVVSQKSRSQTMNRQTATERFVELLREALAPRRRREKTTVPLAVKRRRLEEKKRRSLLKHRRTTPVCEGGG